ncbi:CHRD domain-containing protein [uncultured virus]|nr:CHRD domain-containing protein [uncultured virus]
MTGDLHKNKKRIAVADHGHQENCNDVRCGAQGQVKFCVPVVFQQELISPTGGTGALVPLSTVSQNTDNIHGTLKLKFNSNLSRMAYRLYVYNATNPNNFITDAHLHGGSANENGPVIVNLYSGNPRISNGLLAKGLIGNNNIQLISASTGYAFNSIASLYEGIRRGLVYVNVHSQQFPGGIIRGQVFVDGDSN